MGTLFHRRHFGATGLIAMAAVAAYTFFAPEAVSTSAAQGTFEQPVNDRVVYPVVEPETEVLAATQSADLPSLQINDMPGFTGDTEVDLPAIDPSVIVIPDLNADDDGADITDLRVKYVAATDELIIGLTDVGDSEDVAIALDLTSDGTFDFEVPIPSSAPDRVSPDLMFLIADFSQLPGNDGSLNFGINAMVGSDGESDIGEDTQVDLSAPIAVELDAMIGGFVFADKNVDGIQNPGELGVAGVAVKLVDENGSVVVETTTDADGEYEMTTPPGTYAVEFVPRPGDEFGPLNAGEDRALDSNPNPTTGRTSFTFVGPGEENRTVDAGLT